MTTFDWHIIRRFLAGYLFLIGALIIFFIVLHYVEFIDDFMDREATLEQVFLVYYPNSIPNIIHLISPLAVFLSCVYLTGKLTQELQLGALQTSGVSLYRILRPYLTVALLIMGFMFWFDGWIVPTTNRVVLDFESKYLKDAPRQLDLNLIHRQNSPGSIVSVRFYDQVTQLAYGVSLQQFNAKGNRMLSRIDAQQMSWIDSLGRWRLRDPIVRTFDTDGRESRRIRPSLDTLLTVLPRDLARTERDVETMTIPAAAAYVETLQRTGVNNLGPSLVLYYTKFSYPFANLVVVLLGLPLAAVRRRGGQAVQLGLGLFMAFCYLSFMKLAEPYGYTGELHPALAAWLPHAVFFLLALFLFSRART